MVVFKSDVKRRCRDGRGSDLESIPKRAKVHAQRKFAQGVAASNSVSHHKEKEKTKLSDEAVEPADLLPAERPKTEDFLTFLCFRGTSALPARLDFFNNASSSNANSSNQQETRSKVKRSPKVREKHSAVKILPNKFKSKSTKTKSVLRISERVSGRKVGRGRKVIEEKMMKRKQKAIEVAKRSQRSRLINAANQKRLASSGRQRSGLRSGNLLPASAVDGLASVRKPRSTSVKKAKPKAKQSPEPEITYPVRKSAPPIMDSSDSEDDKSDQLSVRTTRTRSSSLKSHSSPAPSFKRLPSRKTKEAAAVYMEMLNKDLRSPDEEDASAVSDEDESESVAKQSLEKRKPVLKKQNIAVKKMVQKTSLREKSLKRNMLMSNRVIKNEKRGVGSKKFKNVPKEVGDKRETRKTRTDHPSPPKGREPRVTRSKVVVNEEDGGDSFDEESDEESEETEKKSSSNALGKRKIKGANWKSEESSKSKSSAKKKSKEESDDESVETPTTRNSLKKDDKPDLNTSVRSTRRKPEILKPVKTNETVSTRESRSREKKISNKKETMEELDVEKTIKASKKTPVASSNKKDNKIDVPERKTRKGAKSENDATESPSQKITKKVTQKTPITVVDEIKTMRTRRSDLIILNQESADPQVKLTRGRPIKDEEAGLKPNQKNENDISETSKKTKKLKEEDQVSKNIKQTKRNSLESEDNPELKTQATRKNSLDSEEKSKESKSINRGSINKEAVLITQPSESDSVRSTRQSRRKESVDTSESKETQSKRPSRDSKIKDTKEDIVTKTVLLEESQETNSATRRSTRDSKIKEEKENGAGDLKRSLSDEQLENQGDNLSKKLKADDKVNEKVEKKANEKPKKVSDKEAANSSLSSQTIVKDLKQGTSEESEGNSAKKVPLRKSVKETVTESKLSQKVSVKDTKDIAKSKVFIEESSVKKNSEEINKIEKEEKRISVRKISKDDPNDTDKEGPKSNGKSNNLVKNKTDKGSDSNVINQNKDSSKKEASVKQDLPQEVHVSSKKEKRNKSSDVSSNETSDKPSDVEEEKPVGRRSSATNRSSSGTSVMANKDATKLNLSLLKRVADLESSVPSTCRRNRPKPRGRAKIKIKSTDDDSSDSEDLFAPIKQRARRRIGGNKFERPNRLSFIKSEVSEKRPTRARNAKYSGSSFYYETDSSSHFSSSEEEEPYIKKSPVESTKQIEKIDYVDKDKQSKSAAPIVVPSKNPKVKSKLENEKANDTPVEVREVNLGVDKQTSSIVEKEDKAKPVSKSPQPIENRANQPVQAQVPSTNSLTVNPPAVDTSVEQGSSKDPALNDSTGSNAVSKTDLPIADEPGEMKPKLKPSIGETWINAFKKAKIPKPGQLSPISHGVKPFVRKVYTNQPFLLKQPMPPKVDSLAEKKFKTFENLASNSASLVSKKGVHSFQSVNSTPLTLVKPLSTKSPMIKDKPDQPQDINAKPKELAIAQDKSKKFEPISVPKSPLDMPQRTFPNPIKETVKTQPDSPKKTSEGKHPNLPLAVEHTLRKMSPVAVSRKPPTIALKVPPVIGDVKDPKETSQSETINVKSNPSSGSSLLWKSEKYIAETIVNKTSDLELLNKKKVIMTVEEINKWLNDSTSAGIEHTKDCGIFEKNQCGCSFRSGGSNSQTINVDIRKVGRSIVEPPVQLKDLEPKCTAETISSCKVEEYKDKMKSNNEAKAKPEVKKDPVLPTKQKNCSPLKQEKAWKSTRSMTEEEMCEFDFRFERNSVSPRDSGSEISSPPPLKEEVSSSNEDGNLERKSIFHKKRRTLSKSPCAFNAENESSVYAFDPELPVVNGPFRRSGSKSNRGSEDDLTEGGSNSIAVQVNLESEPVLECSTQTETAEDEEEGGSPTFYIPLQGRQAAEPRQMIQGVTVKLDTDDQVNRVIMRAKLVTKLPTNFTRPNPRGNNRSGKPEQKVRPLPTKPPVGTVQPTLRNEAVSSSKSVTAAPDEETVSSSKKELLKQCEDTTVSSTKKPSTNRSDGLVSSSKKQPTVSSDEGTVSSSKRRSSANRDEDSTVSSSKRPSSKNDEESVSSSKKQSTNKRDEEPGPSSGKKAANQTSGKQPGDKASSKPTKMKGGGVFPKVGMEPSLVDAPSFYPNEKEFQDPMEYIEKITPLAEKYGICRIVPPSSFRPECKVSDDMRFTAYNQYVHKMLKRWGPNVKELTAIKKYLATQSIALTQPPWIGGMEIDLPRLYQTVQQCGGLKEVIEKKRWTRVADAMKIPKSAQDRVTKLDDIYCKYLLPYDTLSHSERNRLLDEVEAEWMDKERRAAIVDSSESEDSENSDSDDGMNECITKGRSMALNGFYRIARNTMWMWFGNEGTPPAGEVETEYWRIVESRMAHVCVHSGSIDSGTWGYGFPTTKTSSTSKHPWNLKVLTNNPGSILRSMGPLMGVTVPTLHVGMLFSTFCWYRDPHGLPWIEYLHTGASKIWYGIPDEWRNPFRNAVKSLLPTIVRDSPVWLPSDTAMVPPQMLLDKGVALCRVVQEPGQFIVVFPKAYTSSICTGYLVSESVFFAPSTWLNYARQIFRETQESCEPTMFSLEKLLFSIANDSRSPLEVLLQVLPMIEILRSKEVKERKELERLGLKATERLPKPTRRPSKSEEEHECNSCRATLFLSIVTNTQDDVNYCLSDAIEIITKDPNQLKFCKLLYSYDEEELEELVEKIKTKIEIKTQKKNNSKSSAGGSGKGEGKGVTV